MSTRLLGRNPDRIAAVPGGTPVRADFHDAESVGTALAGAHTFFFVSATESEHRATEQVAVVQAARQAGVERIVYLSFVGAAPDAVFTFGRDHWYTEQAIRAAGVEYTILRDNQYQDLIPQYAGEDGVIRGPAGDGAVAAVTRDDVAAAAAAVLTTAGHAGEIHELTGPRAFTLAEAAHMMTTEFGRHYTYVRETMDEAYASRAKYAAAPWEVDGWVTSYAAIAHGDLETVTDSVERLTGRPPLDFRDFLATVRR